MISYNIHVCYLAKIQNNLNTNTYSQMAWKDYPHLFTLY